MRRVRLTRRRVLVLVLCIATFVEGAVAIAVYAKGNDGSQQPFGNIAYYQGPKVALALFAKRYGDYSDPNCHPVAHRIGSATLARDHGNVSKAFAQGSSACFSGFYHGILERALLRLKTYDAASLASVSRRLCADR